MSENKIITAFFVFSLIGVIVLATYTQVRWNDCYDRGGEVVETKNGWVCAKLEKI